MPRICLRILSATVFVGAVLGQTVPYPYVIKSFAGAFPLGDGGPATSALLYYPRAPIADGAGNLYILDSDNSRIRRVAGDGTISTFAQIPTVGSDMKMAPDGSFYVAGSAEIVRVSPTGAASVIAGTGNYGYGGDGGPATSAQLGTVQGVALDTAGSVYFTDYAYPSMRVRMVTPDGKITTIAGTGSMGYNGDNQPASSASFAYSTGIAVDSAGNVYVADTGNFRIRKFTVGGNISTVAGNGTFAQPANGPSSGSVGYVVALWVDAANNLYTADQVNAVILKITPGGTLTRVAGNISAFGAPGDGVATNVSLLTPSAVSVDKSGDIFLTDGTHRVREVTPDGNLKTVAGAIHFAGDGGPATAAYLNEPRDVALDAQGNVFIADTSNYRIREVDRSGVITTTAGTGTPGIPTNGASATAANLPYVNALAIDSQGAVYLAGYNQVFRVAKGIISLVAGHSYPGDSGDGGPATSATFQWITGVAVDSAGNVYVADGRANRVRLISASTGIVTAFAGTGVRGSSGDGGLATSAQLNLLLQAPLAVDSKNNVYIADGSNYKVRMVSPAGLISTVVGNGQFGSPDGVQATAAPFSAPGAMTFDTAGNLYIASQNFGRIYRVAGGIIRVISGASSSPLVDGTPALSASFFTTGLRVDGNGDLYAVDSFNNTVRKLLLNSPSTLASMDGDQQTGPVGQVLPKLLKVRVTGRAGTGVSGATVSFTVTSGVASLTASSTQTDATGLAAVGLTPGQVGNIVVTATIAGTTLPPVQFNATAVAPCNVPAPSVTSVNSAGDFGGFTTFGPGSWLEIKGTNLAQTTRLWAGSDFKGSNAPTTVDGVSVTIDGKPAYVEYVSPGQLNVQAPADTATGPVQLTVTTASSASCISAPFTVQETSLAPGVLAPAAFNIGGKQYLVAQFSDQVFVGNPNLIPGVAFRPAAPGDHITVFGVGFGDVQPSAPPGTIGGASTLPNVTISFGTTAASIDYAGLAPGTVGEYQFRFVVPNVPDDDYPITFQVGSTKVAQTLYLTVHK